LAGEQIARSSVVSFLSEQEVNILVFFRNKKYMQFLAPQNWKKCFKKRFYFKIFTKTQDPRVKIIKLDINQLTNNPPGTLNNSYTGNIKNTKFAPIIRSAKYVTRLNPVVGNFSLM
jgi:hypothetical protein